MVHVRLWHSYDTADGLYFLNNGYVLSLASSTWLCYIFSPPVVAPASLSDHELPPIWQRLRNISISSFQPSMSYPQGTHVLPLIAAHLIWCHCSQVKAKEALSGVMSENYWCQSVENIALKSKSADNQTLLENHGEASHKFLEVHCSPCQVKPIQFNIFSLCTCELSGMG